MVVLYIEFSTLIYLFDLSFSPLSLKINIYASYKSKTESSILKQNRAYTNIFLYMNNNVPNVDAVMKIKGSRVEKINLFLLIGLLYNTKKFNNDLLKPT